MLLSLNDKSSTCVCVMSHDLCLCSVLNSSLLEQTECVQKLRTYIGSHITEKKEEEELRRQLQVCNTQSAELQSVHQLWSFELMLNA